MEVEHNSTVFRKKKHIYADLEKSKILFLVIWKECKTEKHFLDCQILAADIVVSKVI